MLLITYYRQIFENVIGKWIFCASKVAIMKTKSATIAFYFVFSSFLLPRSFFFSFPFPFLLWFWRLSGPRNLSFEAFSLNWRQMSLDWFSKNRLDIHLYIFITYGYLKESYLHKWALWLYSAKILEISVTNQMERTISVGAYRSIWDHLWRSPLWPDRSFR